MLSANVDLDRKSFGLPSFASFHGQFQSSLHFPIVFSCFRTVLMLLGHELMKSIQSVRKSNKELHIPDCFNGHQDWISAFLCNSALFHFTIVITSSSHRSWEMAYWFSGLTNDLTWQLSRTNEWTVSWYKQMGSHSAPLCCLADSLLFKLWILVVNRGHSPV